MRTPLLLLTACLPLLGLSCMSDPVPEEPPEMSEEDRFALYKDTALAHYDNDDLNAAETQAMRALEIYPDDSQLLLLVGWIKLRRGDPAGVIESAGIFRSLAQYQDYRVTMGLAVATERLGQGYDEAVQDFADGRRSSEEEQIDPRTLEAKALENWNESLTLYHRVLEERPDERKAMSGLVRVYTHLEDYEQALIWSEALLEMTTQELEFFRKQLLRADLSDSEEIRMRRNENELVSAKIETLFLAAPLQVEMNEPEEAIACLNQILELDPREARAFALRGQLNMELELYQDAIADLNNFVAKSDLPPTHPEIHRAYDMMAECRRKDRALSGGE